MKFLQMLLMRLLNSLRNFLRINWGMKEAHTSEGYELKPHDLVSRFIYSSGAIRKQHSTAKPSAFNPEPHPKLSVLHSTALSDEEIWKFARQTLGTQRGRDKIYGRADLFVASLIANRLKAIRDEDPFERHTSVVGWPQNNDPNQRKADIKAICLELSQDPNTRVFIHEPPIQNNP